MTRIEEIAFRKAIGVPTAKLEAMTDEQYESNQDYYEEKALRVEHKSGPLVRPVRALNRY